MKSIFAILLAAALLSGCAAGNSETTTPTKEAETQAATAEPAATGKIVNPLPAVLSADNLDNAAFQVSFESADARLVEGAFVITVTVYDYERFDAAEISALAPGDTLMVRGEPVTVETVTSGSSFVINGGAEAGGYELWTDGDGVYFVSVTDVGKDYYPIGEATLPVAQEFLFTDNADPENQGKIVYPGDFIMDSEKGGDSFSFRATTMRTENGKIVELTRSYMP